ncbi:MAG: NAD(P)/FAD-dependent oxidoreductase [Elusimicrobiota bacterium]
MEQVDLVVVGAGVVGLAVSGRLAPRRTVLVLEKHPRYGVETSSRNSEVIHAGLYYPPGSLKARLCHEGRRRLYAFARETGIFHRKLGKLVVAEDAGRLEAMKAKADASGAEGLELLEGKDAMRRVPGLKASAALWSPETGILDTEEFMSRLYAKATAAGAMFLFQSQVTRVERRPDGCVLTFGKDREQVHSRWVVNSAGLHSDELARMAGAGDYRLHWCKGSYFRHKKGFPLPHLVYPEPTKHSLGIHMTVDRRGGVRFGPDAEFVDKEDYDVNPASRKKFFQNVSAYWPSLREEDLFEDTSGIRPKLSGPEGGFRDFVIAEESGWVNLVGIDSPGLTSSLAIAEEVAKIVEKA